MVARLLLKEGKAKVVRRTPFTIKMLIPTTGYRQPIVVGMDTGSKQLGCAAVTNGQVVYAAEVQLRNDVSKKMKQRATYRHTRRIRKTRYRPARWSNRASMRREGRLAPSIRSKIESHLREKRFVESILPVSRWIVETAQFDIHRITDPDVSGTGYQEGPQASYNNVKAYVLHRDDYCCQHKGRGIRHSKQLHVHHVVYRSQGGSDVPDNLVTLCRSCHDELHADKWSLPAKRRGASRTRHATHMGIIQSQLCKSSWNFTETFGYVTKAKRQRLGLAKTHANDAIAICCAGVDGVDVSTVVLYKRHVAGGDYQQTKGRRSEMRIPTGKLFGMRKFDLIKTPKGIGFVKGKRATGRFVFADITMTTLFDTNVKKSCDRLLARSTTLVAPWGVLVDGT